MVQWIASGRIPPQAEIDGLPWYQVLSPAQQVTVSGVMGTTRSPSWRYEVQVAPGEAPAQSAWRVVSSGTGHGVRTGVLAHIPLSRGRRPVPEVGEAGRLAGRRRTVSPIPTSTCSPSGWSSRTRPGMVGMARRTEFLHEDPSLVGRGAHRSSRARSWRHRCSPPSAPAGPTPFSWPRPTAPSTPTAQTGKTSRAGRCRPLPTPGYHPGEMAYTSRPCRAIPRGEIVGGLAVGDLADASGHDLDVVATDLTGRVWAWNAAGAAPAGLAGADRRRLLGTGRGQHGQRGPPGHPGRAGARRPAGQRDPRRGGGLDGPPRLRLAARRQGGAGLAGRGGGPEARCSRSTRPTVR